MIKKMILATIFVATTTVATASTYKNNGVLGVYLNYYGYPMITSLSILNTAVVPHDNAGADFQMTARSANGNAYNPTLGGDCLQEPSRLDAINENWTGAGLGVSAYNGVLLSVTPRNYNQPGPTCPGPGALLPISFKFGVTIGDGVKFPREMMVMDMSIMRNFGSETLLKNISELPVAYILANVFPYAFYGDSQNNLHPWSVNVGGSLTNHVPSWPYGQNFYQNGKVVMLCSDPNALQNQTAGSCMAFYSNFATTMLVSHRAGASYNLAMMSMTGTNDSGQISDFNWHTLRRFTLVGCTS